MSDADRALHLAELLLWKHYRGRGRKIFLFPVLMALFFSTIVIGTSFSPDALTPATQQSIDRLVSMYFVDVDGTIAYALALFLLQGPYLLAVFAGMIGVRAGNKVASELISSGRFELLLSAPYDDKNVFHALLTGTTVLTLLQLGAFAAIAIGGPLAFLFVSGVEVTAEVNNLLLVAFLLPLPIAVWANLIAILGSLGVGGEWVEGVDDALSLIGIAPGLLLVLTVTIWPEVNLVALSVFALVGISLVTVACTYWVVLRFTAEHILPT